MVSAPVSPGLVSVACLSACTIKCLVYLGYFLLSSFIIQVNTWVRNKLASARLSSFLVRHFSVSIDEETLHLGPTLFLGKKQKERQKVQRERLEWSGVDCQENKESVGATPIKIQCCIDCVFPRWQELLKVRPPSWELACGSGDFRSHRYPRISLICCGSPLPEQIVVCLVIVSVNIEVVWFLTPS